jgi:Copper transport outer membrane protein, MctB
VIDFRYHIVSIVAIFFALGAGVLLGAGPLKNTGSDLVQSQAEQDRKALAEARDDLIKAKALDNYRDSYVSKVTSGLTAAKLTTRKVAIVTMPKAEESVVDGLKTELERAGAQITTQVSLNEKLFDPEQRQLVDPLVNELVTADVTFAKDSTTYQRAGQILGRGIAAKDDREMVDDDATRILSGLTGSKLFGVKPTPKDRASLVIVVAAKKPDPAPENSAYEDAVDFVQGLDTGIGGVVVAGTPDTAENGGLLKALRGDSDATEVVSSVDVANLPSGQATVVFALIEQLTGESGQYGAVEAKDGVAPTAYLVPER